MVAHPDDALELPVPVTTLAEQGASIAVGAATLSVIHLRGHTPGSIALSYDAAGVLASGPHLFTGDSLFPGGPGDTQGDAKRFGQLMDDLEETGLRPAARPAPGCTRGTGRTPRSAPSGRISANGGPAAGDTAAAGLTQAAVLGRCTGRGRQPGQRTSVLSTTMLLR